VYHPHSGYTEARPCSTDAVHDRMGRVNLRSKQGIGNIGGSEPRENNSTPEQTRANIKIYILPQNKLRIQWKDKNSRPQYLAFSEIMKRCRVHQCPKGSNPKQESCNLDAENWSVHSHGRRAKAPQSTPPPRGKHRERAIQYRKGGEGRRKERVGRHNGGCAEGR
jgi:hypothetical protein